MFVKPVKSFLQEAFNKHELKANRLAWIVALEFDSISSSNKVQFYENLASLYRKYQSTEIKYFDLQNATPETEMPSGDYRIKNIELSNIKGIPLTTDGQNFGVNFSLGKEPSSMILLGSNGSGKSSIFETIEYIFSNEIGECKLRNHTDGFEKYLSRFNTKFESAIGIIDTSKGLFDLHKERPFTKAQRVAINPSSNFISAYTLLQNGRLDYESDSEESLHYVIANSLGLQEYLNISGLLNQIVGYRRVKESRDLSQLTARIEEKSNDIKTWEQELNEKRAKLSSNEPVKPDVEKRIQESLLSSLIGVDPFYNLRKAEFPVSEIASLKTSLEELHQFVKPDDVPIDFLSDGLEILNHSPDCPFCNSSKLSKDEIREGVENRIKSYQEYVERKKKYVISLDALKFKLKSLRNDIATARIDLNNEKDKVSRVAQFLEYHGQLETLIHSIISFSTEMDSIPNGEEFDKYLYEGTEALISEFQQLKNSIESLTDQRASLVAGLESRVAEFPDQLDRVQVSSSLRREIQEFETRINRETDQIKELESEVKSLESEIEIGNLIKSESEQFHKVISNEINDIVTEKFKPIKEIVEGILNDYVSDDGMRLSIELFPVIDNDGEKTSEIITAILENKDRSIRVDPKKYYNTFRYKLFATMISVSIILAKRIQYGINLPLIFDDVFIANDFENKARTQDFINHILSYFKNLTSDIPIQLIYFTHDEGLFDGLHSGLNDENIIFAKLFSPDQHEVGIDFKELTYRLPNREELFA